jgi:hypothetical protein
VTKRQRLAILAAPVLTVTMLPVYWLAADLLGREWGWYAGFLVYWPVWCVGLPLALLGWSEARDLLRAGPMSPLSWVLVTLPPVMAAVGRLAGAEGPDRPLLWAAMALVNGALEEMLWRGMYVRLFPGRLRWALAWPTVWFALWHLAPGSVAMGSDVWVLIGGAAVLGAALGWVAVRSRSIRWTVVSHMLAGLAQL